MLRLFGENIWIVGGPTTEVIGFRYPTRSVIIRLSNGDLFVWSPTRLTDELRSAVDALGKVSFLVAPNSLHHLFLGEWRDAYPGARLYAPPGLRNRRKDLVFDADLGDTPAPGWSQDIDQVVVRGNLITTEVVFFHHRSRTAIFTDLIQHLDPTELTGWRALVARLDLMVGPRPETPRKFRWAFFNRGAARMAIRQALAWPTERVVMAHAAPIEADGRAFLSRVFGWLLR